MRSIFEHCSVIWSPQHSTHIEQFAAIQKRAVKWIMGEPFASYNDEVFTAKQRELNILPIMLKFIYNDLILFYKIVNGVVPISLPSYITVCEPEGTRYTRHNAQIIDRSDVSTYNCGVVPRIDAFRNSYFYRTMRKWNSLPVGIRQSEGISAYTSSLMEYLWAADTT